MKSLRVSFTLFLLMIALLVGMPAGAQETPTADVATLESTVVETTTPFETATLEVTATAEVTATVEPTATTEPTPVPPVEEPEPPRGIDWNAALPWIVIGGVALGIALLVVFNAALAKASASIPLAAWEVFVAAVDRGVNQYGDYVAVTPNTTDNAQYEDLQQAWEDFKVKAAEERRLQQAELLRQRQEMPILASQAVNVAVAQVQQAFVPPTNPPGNG